MDYDYITGLLTKVLNGDQHAFTDFANATRSDLENYCRATFHGKCNDYLDEITNDTLYRLYERLHTIKDLSCAYAWMKQTAYRLGLDHLRSEGRRPHVSNIDEDDNDVFDSIPDENVDYAPYDHLVFEEKNATVYDALDDLPERLRDVAKCRLMYEYTIKETSALLGKAEGTVKRQTHEAVTILKDTCRELITAP